MPWLVVAMVSPLMILLLSTGASRSYDGKMSALIAIPLLLVALVLLAMRVRRSRAARVTLIALTLLFVAFAYLAFSAVPPSVCCGP